MRNKIVHFTTIAIILLFGACSNEVLINDNGNELSPAKEGFISLTATMPGDPVTRVALTQEQNLEMKLTWEEGDQLQLVFVQGDTKTKKTATVNKILDEGKKAQFDIEIPKGVTGNFDLYGVYGGGGLSDDNPTLAKLPTNAGDAGSLASVKDRKDVMLYFVSKNIGVDSPNASVIFKHLGSLFSITFKNSGATSVENLKEARIVEVGGDGKWAYNNGAGGNSYDLVTGKFLNTESAGNYISFNLTNNSLEAGKSKTFWSWYPLLDKVWPELKLELRMANDAVVATSVNTKPAKTAPLNAGMVYYLNAEWDGAKLEFKSISDPGPSVKADLLDVVFNLDGSATDVSPMNHTVGTIINESAKFTVAYNSIHKRNVVTFNPEESGVNGTAASFYSINYQNNVEFQNKLADGHSFETLVKFDVDYRTARTYETKFFSTHESGGTGFLIANNGRGNGITFLPNVPAAEGGNSNWIWGNSEIKPNGSSWYHLVGVWDKDAGKAFLYVNGEKRAEVDAAGFYRPAGLNPLWVGIGGDPGNGNKIQNPFKGSLTIARIYDKPLNGEDVGILWKQVKDFIPISDVIDLSDVILPSKRVQVNSAYTIKGEGFQTGDKIRMTPTSGSGKEYLFNGTTTFSSFTLTIPEDFVTGSYNFFVIRGAKELNIGSATLTVSDEPVGPAQVIAHRGHWKPSGSAQNSVTSLIKAQELNVYGSEFDVWITTDGVVVLNHDATISGIRIETSTYDDLKDVRLSNGEKIPTLNDYLVQAKKVPTTKLILEIKTHSASQGGVNNNDRVATAVVQLVKDANMTDQVEYISFSIDVCKKLLQLQPTAIVAYLNGNMTPQALYNLGIKGIDYNLGTIRNNKKWITEAQDLGMTVNVWTVNSKNDLQEVIDYGVDFITTDEPVLAKQLIGNN